MGDYRTGRELYDLTTSGIFQGRIGSAGSGSVLGQEVQFSQTRSVCVAPWAHSNVLVVDAGNNRVLEVAIPGGNLVKVCVCMRCDSSKHQSWLRLKLSCFVHIAAQVWVTQVDGLLGVAASSTLLVVSHAAPSQARVLVLDMGGSIVSTIGGAALGEGDTCCAGSRLGMPSSLAVSMNTRYLAQCGTRPSCTSTVMSVIDALVLTIGCAAPVRGGWDDAVCGRDLGGKSVALERH